MRTNRTFTSHSFAVSHSRGGERRSNLYTLVLLTLVFLYTSWLYQGLKRAAHQHHTGVRQLSQSQEDGTVSSGVQQQQHSGVAGAAGPNSQPSADSTQPASSAGQGRLVGVQLTSSVTGGPLFGWGLDDSFRQGRVGADSTSPQLTLTHLKVVSVAASRHSLLVTAEGSVLSMGPNNSRGGGGHGSQPLDCSGQLGRTTGSAAPGPVTGLEGHQVVQVASGRYHSLAVTADGQLFSFGLNDNGQLGRQVNPAGATTHCSTAAPTLQRHLAATEAATAAAGAAAGAAAADDDDDGGELVANIDADGDVDNISDGLARGVSSLPSSSSLQNSSFSPSRHVSSSSSSGACGAGWSCHSAAPGKVSGLEGVRVVAAAAGRYSSLALDDRGQLWVMGYDSCATGGLLPGRADLWRVRQVQGQLAGKKVVAFDVGYMFWLAATSEGELFSCDNMDDGYAGTLPHKKSQPQHVYLGRTGAPHEPGQVRSLAAEVVTAVAAGRQHALVATAGGRVYSWGAGSPAIRGREGPAEVPSLVLGGLEGQQVLFVAAGEFYSLAATRSHVYGWGSNAYLCTGTGAAADVEVDTPTAVAGPLSSGDWHIQGLAAGYQHAFAIADKPGDAELQQLRAAAAAAAVAKESSTVAAGMAGVEVVLTEQQRQERQKYLQEQEQRQQQPEGTRASSTSSSPVKGASNSPTQAEAVPQQVQGDKLQADKASGQNQDSTDRAAGSLVQGVSTNTGTSTRVADSATPAAGAAQPDPSGSSNSPAAAAMGQLLYPPEPSWHVVYLPAGGQQQAPVQEVWSKWRPQPWHEQLAKLSGDVFALLPKQFNAEHRNPCWGGSGPQLACLPFFNIIGVSKCGTTDLFSRLTQHKLILPATNKGPHFWDECPYPPAGACGAGPTGDFQAYINLFSRAADLIRSRPTAITGEASSNTFTSANGIYLRGFRGDRPFSEFAGQHGSNVSLPALLREAQPYLKLIVMLRNPVDRYYSAFHYYRWWKNESSQPTPEDFHKHAQAEVLQWQDCAIQDGVAACVRRYKPQQLVKGMYHEFLQDWLRHWPRDQLLFLRYEDYKAALPEHLERVLAFLGVPVPSGEDSSTWTAMLQAPVSNKKDYPPMLADTRLLLKTFYDPFNIALAQAMKDKRWVWQDAADTPAT